MKKLLSALITLTLCFSLAVPVFAADPVTPTPPSWMDPEDYLTFPGDPVYEPDAGRDRGPAGRSGGGSAF